MTPRTAILLRIFAPAALSIGLAGCIGTDLAPQTEAARAANAAARGYPRLADVPPEPVDVACVRGALADSLVAVARPAPQLAPPAVSPFTRDDDDIFARRGVEPVVVYRAAVAPPPLERGRFSSVWSSLRSIAGLALGGDEDSEEEDEFAGFVDCPPGPTVAAARLTAAREELERTAAQMRSERPQAPDVSLELPADLPARAVLEAPQ